MRFAFSLRLAPPPVDSRADRVVPASPRAALALETGASGLSESDQRICECLRRGDRDAFTALFKSQYASLAAFAESYLRRRDLAEECVQDVFVRLWENRATWSLRGSLQTYLFGAVRNGALNTLARQRVAHRWTERATADLTDNGMSAPPEPADVQAGLSELQSALAAALGRLSGRRREALLLRVQHRLTNPQIAQVMGITVKCVEMHVSRALLTLKKELAELL